MKIKQASGFVLSALFGVALASTGGDRAAARELTVMEAIAQASLFLKCEKRLDIKLKKPFLKGSYWLVPSYGADGKPVSNLFVDRFNGEVKWPALPSSKCSPAPIKAKP